MHTIVQYAVLLSVIGAIACEDSSGPSWPAAGDEDAIVRSARESLRSWHAHGQLRPLLTCVNKLGEHEFVALFGYENAGSRAIALPLGPSNRFFPRMIDRGQPRSFDPGRHPDAFSVYFTGRRIAWALAGRFVFASHHSRRCSEDAGAPDASVDAGRDAGVVSDASDTDADTGDAGSEDGGAPASGLSVELSFTGTTYLVDSFAIPPDTLGAVGPEHVVELLNDAYAVYRKSDGTRIQASSLAQFWIDAGPPPAGATYDSRLLYDPFSGRFFASSIDSSGGGTDHLLLAVSRSSDPSDGWDGFSLLFQGPLGNGPDFATMGLNRDAVYLYASGTLYVLPKAGLLATPPSVAGATVIPSTTLLTGTGSNLQPVVSLDDSPLPETVLGTFDVAGLIRRWSITGEAGSPVLDSDDGLIAVPAFPDLGNTGVPQPDSTIRISAGESRFASSVLQAGDSLWAVQTIENQGRAALRWFELVGDAVRQTGLIADPVLDFYMGSIARNQQGDVVIGFNGSSPTRFASIYAVRGRTVNGVTSFGAPLLLKAGVAPFSLTGGAITARWGDYSATVVDASDPSTFWTFQEWPLAVDVWSTQIVRLTVAP